MVEGGLLLLVVGVVPAWWRRVDKGEEAAMVMAMGSRCH